MEHIILLVIIAGGIHALSAARIIECDVSIIAPPCTPEEGETVYIRLITSITNYTLVFYKELPNEDLLIFIVNLGKVEIQEEYRNRAEYFINTGTFKLRYLKRTDTGQYSLKAYLPIGIVELVSFTLTVTEKQNFSVSVLLYIGIGVLVGLLVGFLIWRLMRRRGSGYQNLN